MSLEDLMNLEVTSVSKRAQKLSRAPAAITVLSGEDIRRAGHESIPEALRMVPGMHVARMGTHKWAITARGFNGQNGEFANKLLVLIDGRSVYTPSHSGVYWDLQDVLIEDVERIEVIRGPGGTLWGANAVNGVINVITKSASDTQGLLLSGGSGNYDRFRGTARFGGRVGEKGAYRVYSKGFHGEAYPSPGPRSDGGDGWQQGRAGFRFDWQPTAADSLTVLGELFRADLDNRTTLGGFDSGTYDSWGGHLLANWSRQLSERSSIRLQAYYDGMDRKDPLANDRRQTGDIELQHDYLFGERHQLAWGLNYRVTWDRIEGNFMDFGNPREINDTKSFFVQDQVALVHDHLYLTLGSKFELNDFTGFEVQPSARLAWSPNEHHTLWGAISRAVRTPSRAEDDMRLRLPLNFISAFEVAGSNDFASEELLAYEVGYRSSLRSNLTLDATAFYFDYDELLTLEMKPLYVSPPYFVQPLQFENRMNGHSYGAELEASWQVLPRWRLGAGYGWFNLSLSRDPRSTDTFGGPLEHSSPTHQVFVRSLLDLPRHFELDTMLYYVENLSGKVDGAGDPIGSYVRADVRVGWRPTEGLEVSLVGQNLLQNRHEEFGPALLTGGVSVPRSFFAKLTWRY
jgi:iron complex outermembrane receptor protein